jgi:ABC-type cobalamin/Fe3+-siderophores transport system ATPase subunit
VSVLEVVELRREYGRLVALADVSLTVEAGECVALVGPNGSGKSTAVRAIAGLLELSAGTVRVCGHDLRHLEADRPPHFVGQPPDLALGMVMSQARQLRSRSGCQRMNCTDANPHASSTVSRETSTRFWTVRTSRRLNSRYSSASSPRSRAATCSATVLGGSSDGSSESSDESLDPVRTRRRDRPR